MDPDARGGRARLLKAHCETVRIDEWPRVACLREAGLVPTGVEVLKRAPAP